VVFTSTIVLRKLRIATMLDFLCCSINRDGKQSILSDAAVVIKIKLLQYMVFSMCSCIFFGLCNNYVWYTLLNKDNTGEWLRRLMKLSDFGGSGNGRRTEA
jgi:hypothetical protein